jgi:hypothetical protein
MELGEALASREKDQARAALLWKIVLEPDTPRYLEGLCPAISHNP